MAAVLLTTICAVLIYVFFCLGVMMFWNIMKRVLKLKEISEEKERASDLSMVFFTYLILIASWIFAVKIVGDTWKYEWEMVYTMCFGIGISSIVWCYFKFDITGIKFPKWEELKTLKIKKTWVYSLVFIYSSIYGYIKMQEVIGKTEVSPWLSIGNIAMITAAIALDRVLNQIYTCRNEK